MSNANPPVPPAPAGTRERLVQSMRDALATQGYHGIGLTELLANADAPKGVLYHHFPGGKQALALAALGQVVDEVLSSLDLVFERTVAQGGGSGADALAAWMTAANKRLEKSGFERGCALAAVALDTTAADVELRLALQDAFARLRTHLADHLARTGQPATQARGLAALIVATYEGALIQARVAGHGQSMRDATAMLVALMGRAPTSK